MVARVSLSVSGNDRGFLPTQPYFFSCLSPFTLNDKFLSLKYFFPKEKIIFSSPDYASFMYFTELFIASLLGSQVELFLSN